MSEYRIIVGIFNIIATFFSPWNPGESCESPAGPLRNNSPRNVGRNPPSRCLSELRAADHNDADFSRRKTCFLRHFPLHSIVCIDILSKNSNLESVGRIPKKLRGIQVEKYCLNVMKDPWWVGTYVFQWSTAASAARSISALSCAHRYIASIDIDFAFTVRFPIHNLSCIEPITDPRCLERSSRPIREKTDGRNLAPRRLSRRSEPGSNKISLEQIMMVFWVAFDEHQSSRGSLVLRPQEATEGSRHPGRPFSTRRMESTELRFSNPEMFWEKPVFLLVNSGNTPPNKRRPQRTPCRPNLSMPLSTNIWVPNKYYWFPSRDCDYGIDSVDWSELSRWRDHSISVMTIPVLHDLCMWKGSHAVALRKMVSWCWLP